MAPAPPPGAPAATATTATATTGSDSGRRRRRRRPSRQGRRDRRGLRLGRDRDRPGLPGCHGPFGLPGPRTRTGLRRDGSRGRQPVPSGQRPRPTLDGQVAVAPGAAGPASSCRTTTPNGISTTAVVPPYTDRRSETLIACRVASLLTTNSPSCSLCARSNSAGLASRALMSSSSVGGQAQAAVFDLGDQARAHPVGPDLDPGVGRGEHRGVLDQLGDQVDDVADRVPRDQVVRLAGHVDPDVVFDLGHRGPQDVDHRHRVAPAAAGHRARQDDQALGVPAHAGGEVVEAEQVGERPRLAGPPLHRVQHPQLPVQQGLVAHGDVQEDLVDSLAQPWPGRRRRRRPRPGRCRTTPRSGRSPRCCWWRAAATRRRRRRHRPAGAARPRAAAVRSAISRTLSFSPVRSLVTLRPNQTSRKTEADHGEPGPGRRPGRPRGPAGC